MLAGVLGRLLTLASNKGGDKNPSNRVVSAVARALQCDRNQHNHMLHLAGHPVPPRSSTVTCVRSHRCCQPARGSSRGDRHRPRRNGLKLSVAYFEAGLDGEPGRGRNLIWEWFADPDTRAMPRSAGMAALRSPRQRLAGRLQVRQSSRKEISSRISLLSARHCKRYRERRDVAIHHSDTKVFVHPEVEYSRLRCEVLLTPDDDISLLCVLPDGGHQRGRTAAAARRRRFAEDLIRLRDAKTPRSLVFTGIAGSYFGWAPVGIEHPQPPRIKSPLLYQLS